MPPLSKPEFAKELRQALNNLHDFAALQKLPLAALLSAEDRTLDQGVRQLRAELLSTIEQLNPLGSLSSRAKERRPYAILYGRYVQGMSTTELVEELAISIRQLRREQARALDAMTDLMWEKMEGRLAALPVTLTEPTATGRQEATEAEAEQLISQSRTETLSLATLISGLVATLTPVATGRGIALEQHLAEDLPPVRANRVVLRQGLMELISSAMRRLADGHILVESKPNHQAQVSVLATGHMQASPHAQTSLDVSQRLILSLGGKIEISEEASHWCATVWLPTAEEWPILVMDDNVGLIELFRRYLAGREYRVIEAHSTAEILDLARQLPLRLIVLDVMLPEQDGWEVLQHLRAAPETQALPILICSALSEPEIAFALGASDYLTKPVTQNDLLTKVERWCNAP
jgi:CheY-like chemotaxis protein